MHIFPPALNEDAWFRHLLTTNEVRKNGTLKHPKVWENFFRAPEPNPQTNDLPPWNYEISGRSRLSCANIVDHARHVAATRKEQNPDGTHEYRGFIFMRVMDVRAITITAFDVFLTPNEDAAHADLVTTEEWPMIAGKVRIEVWLALSDAATFGVPNSNEVAILEAMGP